MSRYIKNVGLFKTYRYFIYKLKSGAYSKKNIGRIKTMNLTEFNEEITDPKNQKPFKLYLVLGISLLSISYLLVFIL